MLTVFCLQGNNICFADYKRYTIRILFFNLFELQIIQSFERLSKEKQGGNLKNLIDKQTKTSLF